MFLKYILSRIWHARNTRPGVYRIQNTITGREYIGATTQPMRDRWKQHRDNLALNRHKNRMLQRDWNTYGASAFIFSVIEVVQGGHDKVFERERYWQDKGYDRMRRYNPANGDVQETYFAQSREPRYTPDQLRMVAERFSHYQLTINELVTVLALERDSDTGEYRHSSEKIIAFVGGRAAEIKETIATVRGSESVPPTPASAPRPKAGW